MQSGSPTAYWALLRPPADAIFRTIRFAQKLGCYSTHDMHTLKQCLKTKKWEDIVNEKYEVSLCVESSTFFFDMI